MPTDLAERTADLLAEAGVAIMSHGPGGATMPPLKLLREHGVEVFGGSDNIRDAWSPFGNGDMLERAMMIGYRANFRHDEELALAFDMVTAAAARVAGHHAAMASRSAARPTSWSSRRARSPKPVAARPRRKLVIKAGRIRRQDGVLISPEFGDRQWRRVRPCSAWSRPASSTARPRVFGGVSFLLDGARTALVGENGAGKSTLLKCLTGRARAEWRHRSSARAGCRLGSVPQDVPAGLAERPVRDVLHRSLASRSAWATTTGASTCCWTRSASRRRSSTSPSARCRAAGSGCC